MVAAGLKPGDEVITTPMTFVSTNHVILHERLTPVFADVDEYLCLDPDSVAARIGPRTRAVSFVGLGGNVGRWVEVRDLCRERGIKTIVWFEPERVHADTLASIDGFFSGRRAGPTGPSPPQTGARPGARNR